MAKRQQITTLASKLILDTREFEDGSTASRKELNTIRKAMQDTETPLEKYERKMADLGDVLAKDSRFLETYNRKAKQFRKEMKDAEAAADGFHDELKEGSKIGDSWAMTMTGVASSIEVAEKALNVLTVGMEKVSNLDNEIFELEKFGVAAKHFGTFKVLASDSRLEVEDLADATKNLTIRLGEAVDEPQGGISDVFRRLNLDAAGLFKQKPIEQLKAFSAAVQDIPDYTAQLQVVDELLSDSGTKILDTILLKRDAVEQAAQRAADLGIGLSEDDRENIELAAKASKEMALAWEGFTNKVTVMLAPLLEDIFSSAALILKNKDAEEIRPDFVAKAQRMIHPTRTNFGITTDEEIIRKSRQQSETDPLAGIMVKQTEILQGIKFNQENQQPIGANIGQ